MKKMYRQYKDLYQRHPIPSTISLPIQSYRCWKEPMFEYRIIYLCLCSNEKKTFYERFNEKFDTSSRDKTSKFITSDCCNHLRPPTLVKVWHLKCGMLCECECVWMWISMFSPPHMQITITSLLLSVSVISRQIIISNAFQNKTS